MTDNLGNIIERALCKLLSINYTPWGVKVSKIAFCNSEWIILDGLVI